jgi:hypothetical protein
VRSPDAPFVMLPHWLLLSDAYRDLNPVARALLVEVKMMFNGRNNGFIHLGVREAGTRLGVGKNVAERGFDALLEHGFLKLASPSTFDQKRLAREWLLTDERDDRNGTGPTKDFMRWTLPRVPRGANPGQKG